MCINSTHCTLITQQVISLSGHRGKNWPHVMLCVCVCAKKSISLLIFWSENCFDERSFHFSGRKKKIPFHGSSEETVSARCHWLFVPLRAGEEVAFVPAQKACSPSYLDCLFVRRHSISGVASVGNASFISVHCVTDQEAATFLSRRRWWRWWRRSTKMMHHHRPFSSSFFFLDQGIFCRKCKWNFG